MRRTRKKTPPVILSQHGQTTESARARAAQNMIEDPDIRLRVEELLVKQAGGDRERGLAEFARRYPEVIDADGRKPS